MNFNAKETFGICDFRPCTAKYFYKYIKKGYLRVTRKNGRWGCSEKAIIDYICHSIDPAEKPQSLEEMSDYYGLSKDLERIRKAVEEMNLRIVPTLERLWLRGELDGKDDWETITDRLAEADLGILKAGDIFDLKVLAAVAKCREKNFLKFAAIKQTLKPHINLTDFETAIESVSK